MRSYARSMKTRSLPAALFGIFTFLVAFCPPGARGQNLAAAGAAKARQVFRSPDGAFTAEVISVKQRRSYGINPSRIEIRNRKGRLVAERDHSMYPSQGLTVAEAAWTKDARFFVYQTEESGGHSPWHKPTFL